jgi:two-component system response regulator (stage 0 sporulation protein A)
MDTNIPTLLRKIGLRGTLKGFHYLARALQLALDNPALILNLTTQLYPAVAETFGVSPAQVERSMRTTWEHGDIAALESLIGYHLKGRPSVGELIDILGGYLRSHADASGHLF